MSFPIEKMGVTGSLAYGKVEEEDMDFDVIFMGNPAENLKVRDKLHRLSQVPECRVFEFGRYWPIRIMHNGFLLCPFFVYENWDDVPLGEAEVTVIKEEVVVTGIITDDSHNSYLPIVLELADPRLVGFFDPRIDNHITLVINNGVEFFGLKTEQCSDLIGQRPEKPDVCHRNHKLNVSRTFATYLFFGNFNTTAITNDTFVPDPLVFAAMTFPVFHRAENAFTKQSVAFGLVCPVVDGLGFEYLTV
jgi:spore maturation protein CgeB